MQENDRIVRFADELPPVMERVFAFDADGRTGMYMRHEGNDEIPEVFETWMRPEKMSQQLKVKTALELCQVFGDDIDPCPKCPYKNEIECRSMLHRDARALLRERESGIAALSKARDDATEKLLEMYKKMEDDLK